LSLVKNSIFGLVIPEGMTPVPGPEKVYRFEGYHPITQVYNEIRRQASIGEIAREGNGYLLRNVRVRRSRSGRSRGAQIALRIFKSQASGATLDIWLEKYYAKKAPPMSPAKYISGGALLPTYKAVHVKRRRQSKQAKPGKMTRSLQQTVNILAKMRRGETLTQEEMDHASFN